MRRSPQLSSVSRRNLGPGARCVAGPYGKGLLASPLASKVVAVHPAPGDGWFGRMQSRRRQ